MCVADGSVDLYTSTCPMCKVFRHPSRCPHKRETCRNHANHPRNDVVYITNAEVQTFNGCGYCKWARMNPPPPPSRSGMHNPGWPGCCRPPQPSELEKIPPADWPAVHTVHRTPIPPDVKQLLDTIKIPYGSQGGSLRTSPTTERKSLARANSSPNGSVRSPSMAIPQKGRVGGSPQLKPSSLVGSGSRHAGAQLGASPGNNASFMDNSISSRRAGPADTPLKRVEGFRTTPPASVRKLVDGEQRPPVSRPSLTAANLLSLSPPHGEHPSLKHRSSAVSTNSTPLAVATNRANATPNKAVVKITDAAKAERDRTPENGLKALNISGASDSSSSSGSRSSDSSLDGGGTVTSDGGFTDYLSDESEAELQRQAEVRAAILEQNRMEEQEFRLARQQLASVDLHPPQAWTTGVTSSRKAINTGYSHGG